MKMIIFDMDGTLINSGSTIANCVNHVRENIGLQTMDKSYILENVNDININSSEFFYNSKTFTPLITSLFEDFYAKNCLIDLHIYDGIKDILDDFKNDFKFCVATNAHSDYARKMLDYLDIQKYFSTILGYNDVKEPKPNPEMINIILDKYGAKKENVKVIGDSIKDTTAALGAGVNGILVNWGFSNYEKNKNVLNSVEELRKILKTSIN
ncbi:HAD family hydrolase [Aliarcobacter thereius]|uniref:HAD family hydrolase n=1 Tax=Aliarcobacter thereius TaxID=544718 RepID=UPI0010FF2714|nr:HAD family hydrolase [Aliarcobacter thereius]TLT06298.1 HAD family hydrolase [Aliarcobacter thereius]